MRRKSKKYRLKKRRMKSMHHRMKRQIILQNYVFSMIPMPDKNLLQTPIPEEIYKTCSHNTLLPANGGTTCRFMRPRALNHD